MRLLIFCVLMLLPSTQILAKECVVLLHGYNRTSQCLKVLENTLVAGGYSVQNITYPTTKYSIEEVAKEHIAPRLERVDCDKIHFVGHSMGGIVIRKYLADYKPPQLGKVVLITTPNKGSEVVSRIKAWPFIASILGPAAMDLEVGSNLLQSLAEPYYKVGIVRATKPKRSFVSLFLEGDKHDGILSHDSMLLSNKDNMIDIYATHNRILVEPELGKYIKSFLKTGSFAGG